MQNKWAVVIGISDHRGRASDLQYCDDDARDMYSYLLEMGYPEGNRTVYSHTTTWPV